MSFDITLEVSDDAIFGSHSCSRDQVATKLQQNQVVIKKAHGCYYLVNPFTWQADEATEAETFFCLTVTEYEQFINDKKIKLIIDSCILSLATAQATGNAAWQLGDTFINTYVFNYVFPVFMGVAMGCLAYNMQINNFRKQYKREPTTSELQELRRNAIGIAFNLACGAWGYDVGLTVGKLLLTSLHVIPHTWLAHIVVCLTVCFCSALFAVGETVAEEKLRYGRVKSSGMDLLKLFAVSFVSAAAWYAISILPIPDAAKPAVHKVLGDFSAVVLTFVAILAATIALKPKQALMRLGQSFCLFGYKPCQYKKITSPPLTPNQQPKITQP